MTRLLALVSALSAASCAGSRADNRRSNRIASAKGAPGAQVVLDEPDLDEVLAQLDSFPVAELPPRVYRRDGYDHRYDSLTAYRIPVDWLDKPLIGRRPIREFISVEYRWRNSKYYSKVPIEGDYYYAIWDRRLLKKFLRIHKALGEAGFHPERLKIYSCHRTPRVNNYIYERKRAEQGVVNTSKRSYHLKGMALDIIFADVNGDGKTDKRDQLALLEAVDQVERRHPELRGGLGVYVGNIHTDVRRKCAFWCGKGPGKSELCPRHARRCRRASKKVYNPSQ